MKKTSLIVLTVIAMFANSGCRKNKTTALNPNADNATSNIDESNLKLIPQKNYNVTGAGATKIVKTFKHLGQNDPNMTQNKLIEADSVLLDSAIFVIEAALNYDFDYNANPDEVTEDVLIDATTYTIPKSRLNNKISSNDLDSVYNELTTFINSQISAENKIAIIDIEAYEVGTNQVSFKAIPRVVKVLAQMYWCGTNTSSGYASGINGSSSTAPLATGIINYFLRNCDFPLTGCSGNFYINAQTFNYNNQFNAYPALYYSFWLQSTSSPVYVDNAYLAAAQINSRRTNCVALAQSGLSSLSSLHKVVSISLSDAFEMYYTYSSTGMPFPAGLKKTYWVMPVTYGVPTGC